MLCSCTRKYTDESDAQGFSFTFYCDNCGKGIKSQYYPFAGAAFSPEDASEKRLWESAWKKMHLAAFRRANEEMKNRLFSCPACHEYVCEDCVRLCRTANEPRPICKKCLIKEQLPGAFTYGRR